MAAANIRGFDCTFVDFGKSLILLCWTRARAVGTFPWANRRDVKGMSVWERTDDYIPTYITIITPRSSRSNIQFPKPTSDWEEFSLIVP